MSWFSRLFRTSPNPSQAPEPPLLPAQPPDWAVELLEAVRKLGRSQAKGAALVESLEVKLEGGFADLRSAIAAAPSAPAAVPAFDAVFDALDILDEARRSLKAMGSDPVERGLARVTERLEGHLADSGLSRRVVATMPLDGKVFRVVGTVQREDLPDGALAQVVRAAVVAGDRVVREGEILINRRSLS